MGERDQRAEGVFPPLFPNLTSASQNLFELIKAQSLVAYPDADLRLAIQRSIAVETSRGWRIAKEKASARIDVVVALAQAALAAVRKGELGRMRMGTAMMTGTGPSIVTWHDEPRTYSRIRWATIKVDGDGNEVKPLRRRGLL